VRGWEKAETWVVVPMAEDDDEPSAECRAPVKASPNELRTDALPLMGWNDGHRPKPKPM